MHMNYVVNRNIDEDRQLESDVELLREKGEYISSDERYNKKRNKNLH